jgi:hypothetical protein
MRRILLPSLLGILSACGSGSGGTNPGTTTTTDTNTNVATCTAYSPCGGNVVGTWRFTQMCPTILGNPYASVCASSTYTQSGTGFGASFLLNGYESVPLPHPNHAPFSV